MSNSKIAALTVAFNETYLLKACVRQFKPPYIDKSIFHLVLISERPWRGEYEYDNRTVLSAMGANHIEVNYWENQTEQFNWGLNFLASIGFEWAIICDADEFYTSKDISQIKNEMSLNSGAQALYAEKMAVYWKLPIFKIAPQQTDNPIIAIKTTERFVSKRHAEVYKVPSQATLHHLSYVRTNDEMKKKIDSFEHSNEFNRVEWYNNSWLNGKENLHPVVPEQFKFYYHSPAPEEILENLYVNREYFKQG